MRTMVIGGLLAAGLALAASAGVAHAGKPVRHACAGETFRQAAHEEGPLGRDVIRGFARGVGLGGGVQELQAGVLPDDVAANTCND